MSDRVSIFRLFGSSELLGAAKAGVPMKPVWFVRTAFCFRVRILAMP